MAIANDIRSRGNGIIAGTQVAAADKISVVSPGQLVSILIPCCGMIEYTKLCVPSVLKHSRAPFELIFLDVGSLDGTAEYLAGIKAASGVRVEVVRSLADLGLAEACKEAIGLALGEYLVLLNNDTVVTHDWLNHLVSLVNTSPAFGMVGPMSNYAEPPQLVETVPYRVKSRKRIKSLSSRAEDTLLDLESMNAFARELTQKNNSKWMKTDHLSGFCLLMKREVINRVGIACLEQSELILFDTTNLCLQVQQAGYTLACCRDIFIHHFGTRTFSHGAPAKQSKTSAAAGATS